MPTNGVRTEQASSIENFLRVVFQINADWQKASPEGLDVWYRGVNDREYKLLPGAYRRRSVTADVEESLYLGFQHSAPAYLDRRPLDPWDWYFLAQHYGLPTRLLDWTESPLAALHFALRTEKASADPCVWLMDAGLLNSITLGPANACVLVPGPRSKNWLPEACAKGRTPIAFSEGNHQLENKLPIAMFPSRSDPRIIAQQATFTVHGTEVVPIEQVFKRQSCDRIAKIVLDRNHRKELQEHLQVLRFTELALFPELSKVAEDLMRQYEIN